MNQVDHDAAGWAWPTVGGMQAAGIRVRGARSGDVLRTIEHELNEATDSVLDRDEPARWSLLAEAGGQRFTSVLAVLDHARRTKQFPRALKLEWRLLVDDAGDSPAAATVTGVLRPRPLVGFRLQLQTPDARLRDALANELRPRLRRLDGVDHSPSARPRTAALLREVVRQSAQARAAAAEAAAQVPSSPAGLPEADLPVSALAAPVAAADTPVADLTPASAPLPSVAGAADEMLTSR